MKVEYCEFPEDVFFDVPNDVWLRVSAEARTAVMGITTVYSFLAGKLSSVKMKTQLSDVKSQQSIATLESSKYFGSIRSPVSGRISKFNSALSENPVIANRSPYDEGWVAEFSSFDSSELSRLKKGEGARDSIKARIAELRVKCFTELPDDEMFSIGTECSTTVANLNQLLEKRPMENVVHLVTDDPTSEIEMIRWSDQTKNKVLESRKEGNLFHFIVKKAGE